MRLTVHVLSFERMMVPMHLIENHSINILPSLRAILPKDVFGEIESADIWTSENSIATKRIFPNLAMAIDMGFKSINVETSANKAQAIQSHHINRNIFINDHHIGK